MPTCNRPHSGFEAEGAGQSKRTIVMLENLRNTRRRVARQPRRRASPRRHFRNGCRAAAARALTAARLYVDKKVLTLAAAAACCGSSVPYVQAGIVLIEDQTAPSGVLESVLEGHVL